MLFYVIMLIRISIVTVCFLVTALLKPHNKEKRNKYIGKIHNSKTSYLAFGIRNKIVVLGANDEYTRPSCFGPKKGFSHLLSHNKRSTLFFRSNL